MDHSTFPVSPLISQAFFQNNMHLSMLFYVTEHRALQWRTYKGPRTEGNHTVEPANPIMMALVSVTGSTVTRDNFETISDCAQVLIRQDKPHSKNACMWCPDVGCSRAIGPERVSVCP